VVDFTPGWNCNRSGSGSTGYRHEFIHRDDVVFCTQCGAIAWQKPAADPYIPVDVPGTPPVPWTPYYPPYSPLPQVWCGTGTQANTAAATEGTLYNGED